MLSRLRELIAGSAASTVATTAARAEIEGEMRNAGLELSMANALDPQTLLMLLGSPTLDERRAFLVGSLLHLDGLRARADGEAAWAARSFRAALVVLTAARPSLDAERADLADQAIAELRALTGSA